MYIIQTLLEFKQAKATKSMLIHYKALEAPKK